MRIPLQSIRETRRRGPWFTVSLCLAFSFAVSSARVSAQGEQPRKREAIRSMAVGKITALSFQIIATRTCPERRAMTNAPAPSVTGGGRAGTIWLAAADGLHLRIAKTGEAIERFRIPEALDIRALCSDPSGSRLFLFDANNRLLTFDPILDRRHGRRPGRPVPVRGWRPAWIPKGHRIQGVTFEPIRQWLFFVTSANVERPVMCFDLARGELLASMFAPACGCYDLVALTGVAWDVRRNLLFLSDPSTTISARMVRGQDGILRLQMHHYCVFQGTPQPGLAVVQPSIRSSLGPRSMQLSSKRRDVRLLSTQGAPRAPGFMILELGSDRPAWMRTVGDGATHELATPVLASGLGITMSIRWQTRVVASDPAEAPAVDSPTVR